MTRNRLLGLRGAQFYRLNNGPVTPLRASVRFVGLRAVDHPELQRIELVADTSAFARVTYAASIEGPGDYWTYSPAGVVPWAGVTADFDRADDVFVIASEPGVRIAGFGVPSGAGGGSAYRKTLHNAGAAAFMLHNFRLAGEESAPDGADPGMLQARPRALGSGESARLVWDPIGLRWLVNAGLHSGNFITIDSAIATVDGATLTRNP